MYKCLRRKAASNVSASASRYWWCSSWVRRVQSRLKKSLGGRSQNPAVLVLEAAVVVEALRADRCSTDSSVFVSIPQTDHAAGCAARAWRECCEKSFRCSVLAGGFVGGLTRAMVLYGQCTYDNTDSEYEKRPDSSSLTDTSIAIYVRSRAIFDRFGQAPCIAAFETTTRRRESSMSSLLTSAFNLSSAQARLAGLDVLCMPYPSSLPRLAAIAIRTHLLWWGLGIVPTS